MGGGWRHPYRRSVVAALVVGVSTIAAGCSSGGGTKRALPTTTTAAVDSATSTTGGATTTTKRPPTSSTAPPTTTRSSPITPAPDAIGRFTDPGDAATHLYNSWKADNRPEAQKAASAGAIDSLFARTWQGPDYTLAGCTNREFGYDCRFTRGATGLLMRVEGGASAGYHVETVTFG